MALINKPELVSDAALKAPYELKKGVDQLIKSLEKLRETTKKSDAGIASATTTSKLVKETANLKKSQEELGKVQQKVALNAKTLWLSENEVAESMKRNETATKRTGTVLSALDKQQAKVANSAAAMSGAQETYIKAAKRSQQATGSLGGEYKKLTAQLGEAVKKYKDMAAAGGSSNQALQKQQKIVSDLQNKVKTIDASVGQFQRNVGNYPKVFGAATRSVVQFMQAFGLVSGIYLVARAIKDLIVTSIEFERSNSRLAGILGKTKSEIKELREQQIALNETTVFTAKEYAELQLELAKLGFPIEQIKQMTESTAQAAIAMGSGLAEQAELTGSILHQFGLDANQTSKVNDQLAKSTTSSALNFEKLATAMPYVGSAAAALGFNLEETLALMGQLSNAGLQSSTIGTSLRKIFLLLADSSSNLSKKFKEPVRDLPSLLKGLKQLSLNNTELAEALELTDVRSVIAFQTLIEGADKVETLSGTIRNATGFTKELADTVSDDLKGDLTLLGSAVSSVSTALGEASEGAMRTFIQWLTRLVLLLKEIPTFVKENKAAFITLGLALVTFNLNLVTATLNLIKLRFATLKAIVSIKALTTAVKANPLGFLLLGITAIITAFNVYNKTVGETARQIKEFSRINDELNNSIERSRKVVADLTLNESEYRRESKLSIALNKIKLEYKLAEIQADRELAKGRLSVAEMEASTLGIIQQQNIAAARKNFGEKKAIEVQKKYTEENLKNNKSFQEQKEKLDAIIKGFDEQEEAINSTIKSYEDFEKIVKEINKQESNEKQVENENNKLKLYQDQKKALIELDNQRLKSSIEQSKIISDNENQSLTARNNALEAQESYYKKIAGNERDLALIQDINSKEWLNLINSQVERGIITKEKGNERILELERISLSERTKVLENYQSTINKITQDNEDTRAKIAYDAQIKALNDSKALAIENAKELVDAREKAFEFEITQIQQQAVAGVISKEQADRQIIALEKKRNEEILKERIEFQKSIGALEDAQFLEAVDIIKKSKMEEVDKNAAILELEEKHGERKKEILKEINQLENDLSDEQYENIEGRYDYEIEQLEKFYEIFTAYSQAIGDLFGAISDRRTAQIDSEIRENKRFYDEQIRLAGDNEKAKDELRNEAARKEAELEKKRIDAQRKAAAFEKATALIQAGIQTSLNILKAFPNPILMAFAASLGAIQIAAIAAKPLPQYAEGTDNHPGGKAIVGEKGTELGRTPDGKMFLTPNKASVMNLPKGTEIIPNDQTMRMLAMDSVGRVDSVRSDYALHARVESLEKAIRETNGEIVTAIIENQVDYAQQGSLMMKIQKKRDGSKKITHSRGFGY